MCDVMTCACVVRVGMELRDGVVVCIMLCSTTRHDTTRNVQYSDGKYLSHRSHYKAHLNGFTYNLTNH